MKTLIILCLISFSVFADQWIETDSGIGLSSDPNDQSTDIVRVQTPRIGGIDSGMKEYPPNKWILIDVTDADVPLDAVGVCLQGRIQISKGSAGQAAQTNIYVRPVNSNESKGRVLWKVRSTSGASGERENTYGCIAVDNGYFELMWEAIGWQPLNSNKSSGCGAIEIRVNQYFR